MRAAPTVMIAVATSHASRINKAIVPIIEIPLSCAGDWPADAAPTAPCQNPS
jgi:hypothetical protein